jgi:hypothetical protein
MKTILKSVFITSMAAVLIAPVSALTKEPRWLKEQKELALQSCLAQNYRALGSDIYSHDYSAFHPRYKQLTDRRGPEYDLKYIAFLEENAGGFYKEEISVKAEGRNPPFTTIFAKCMEFSESKALRDFITKNPL